METVDMSRYVQNGAGANGESFDCLDDESVMLKLYNASYPIQPVIDELEIARLVYDLGVPSPKPGELVEVDGRVGIKFRKVLGKRSYSRALADEPERVEEFAREFAVYAKKLHSTVCPEEMFPEEKPQFLALLDAYEGLSEQEYEILRRFILSLPDCNTAVHGDLHTGNLLTTLPKGAPLSSPHEVLFIDLGYFASGCPLLDIGMLDAVCNYGNEEYRIKEMHVGHEITSKFWKYFVDEYFFAADKLGEYWFGEGVRPEDIEERMLPYTAVKMLLVAFNAGFMPPEYVRLMKDALRLLTES